MEKKFELKIEDKRVWIRGLLVECPMGDPAPDCPLHKLREFPLAERMNMVKEMSIETIDQLIAHHQMCLRRREA